MRQPGDKAGDEYLSCRSNLLSSAGAQSSTQLQQAETAFGKRYSLIIIPTCVLPDLEKMAKLGYGVDGSASPGAVAPIWAFGIASAFSKVAIINASCPF